MGLSISNAFRVSINPSSLPAWLSPLAVNQIKQIPNTKQSGTQPLNVMNPSLTGPAAIINAWGGMALDRDNSIIFSHGGGHADYAGNAVYRLALNVDSPAWQILRDNTPEGQYTQNATNRYYLDGRPCSAHTYSTLQWHKPTKRMMRVGAGAAYMSGNYTLQVDGFNLLTNDWDPAGTYLDIPSGGQGNAWLCTSHPTTNLIYYQSVGNVTLYTFNASTNHWSVINNNVGVIDQYTTTPIDTLRNHMLRLGGGVGPVYYDLNNGGAENAITLTGVTITNLANAGGCATYCADIDKFLYLPSAGTPIYRINPVTWAVDILTTTGDVVPASQWQMENKFQWVPNLKGCVMMMAYDSNVAFLRTS